MIYVLDHFHPRIFRYLFSVDFVLLLLLLYVFDLECL